MLEVWMFNEDIKISPPTGEVKKKFMERKLPKIFDCFLHFNFTHTPGFNLPWRRGFIVLVIHLLPREMRHYLVMPNVGRVLSEQKPFVLILTNEDALI